MGGIEMSVASTKHSLRAECDAYWLPSYCFPLTGLEEESFDGIHCATSFLH